MKVQVNDIFLSEQCFASFFGNYNIDLVCMCVCANEPMCRDMIQHRSITEINV